MQFSTDSTISVGQYGVVIDNIRRDHGYTEDSTFSLDEYFPERFSNMPYIVNSINYEPLYPRDKDSLMFVVTMNYKADIASYFVYLNENGLDVSDPCKIADIVASYNLNSQLV